MTWSIAAPTPGGAGAVKTIARNLWRILAHREEELSTALMAGPNRVLSAVKRKARGYRHTEYVMTLLYSVTGDLQFDSYPSHGKW